MSELSNFSVEYAKSGRSKCVKCENRIMKHAIRVKKMVNDTDVAMRIQAEHETWYHLDCFAGIRGVCGFNWDAEELPKFSLLTTEDQETVRNTFLLIEDGAMGPESRQREPLYDMLVVIIGKTTTPKKELKLKIERMGGKLVTKLEKGIAVVISTAEVVKKMGKRMKEVQSYNIQVVAEEFLTAIENGTPADTLEMIKTMSICTWESEPSTGLTQEFENIDFQI